VELNRSRDLAELGSALQGLRILVVEDEYVLADDLAQNLRDAGAVPIGPFPTVAQAEAALAAEGADAAILDLNLRGTMTSGLVERLSAERLPCLVVSGYGAEALPDTITVPHLEKPVDAGAAVARLAREIERRRSAAA